MGAYEYVPELINKLEPAPEYGEQGIGLNNEKRKRKRDSLHNLERYKTGVLAKNASEDRFQKGRIHSHYGVEKMRKDVADIKE